MNNAGPRLTSRGREIAEVEKETVNDCSGFRRGPGMDHESRRLLDDCQILVLDVDLEWDLLRCECLRFEDLQVHFDGLSSSNPVTILLPRSVYKDGAGTVKRLNLRPGEIVQTLGKKDIQPQAAVARFGQEFHFG